MKTLRFSFKIMAIVGTMLLCGLPVAAETVLSKLLPDVNVGELVDGAEAFGTTHADIPAVQVLKGGERIGWAFVTSDFVSTTGYSGKPIHTMVAVDDDAQVIGVQLVKHSEPIVLIGIPDSKVKALVANYRGLDLVAEAESGGTAHQLDIISGATVTIMVIDDSIVRAGLKVARQLGLGGLAVAETDTGPQFDRLRGESWWRLEGHRNGGADCRGDHLRNRVLPSVERTSGLKPGNPTTPLPARSSGKVENRSRRCQRIGVDGRAVQVREHQEIGEPRVLRHAKQELR